MARATKKKWRVPSREAARHAEYREKLYAKETAQETTARLAVEAARKAEYREKLYAKETKTEKAARLAVEAARKAEYREQWKLVEECIFEGPSGFKARVQSKIGKKFVARLATFPTRKEAQDWVVEECGFVAGLRGIMTARDRAYNTVASLAQSS